MKFYKLKVPGLWLIKPDIFYDKRGYFFESFRDNEFISKIGKVKFVQDNESFSVKGVLRGFHFQIKPFAQAKLVRVIKGSIIDMVIDLRKDSPYFGKLFKFRLNDQNKYILFIPEGFAHGFLALSDAVVVYKVNRYYAPQYERGINPLSVDTGLEGKIISHKDLNFPSYQEVLKAIERGEIEF